MKAWNVIRARLRALFRRDAILGDIDEELRLHVDLLIEENLRRGMTPEEAQAAARREFGNLGTVRDTAYDVRGGGMFETLLQDLRFGGRMLRKRPGLTLSAVLTMALGIGATSAVFSVVHPLLIRSLPFHEPDRLAVLLETCVPKFPEFSVASGNFLTWRDRSRTFSSLVATKDVTMSLTGGGEPQRLRGRRVTPGFFDLFGVQPVVGRGFRPEEELPGKADVVVISDGLWQQRFGGDRAILDRTLILDGKPHVVVGVMPPRLHPAMGQVDFWTPAALTAEDRQNYGGHSFVAFGRLGPGATFEAARAELDQIAVGLEHDHPDADAGWRVKIMPLADAAVEGLKPTLGVLSVAVAFLLLIACANVASLLLGRAATREREIAVRVALGASRWRIVRQLASESALLALLGGALGLALGVWGVDLLLGLAPDGLVGLKEVSLDLPLVGFAFLASLGVGVLVGLVPAFQAFKIDLNAALKEGGRSGSEGGGRARVRRVLVAIEVAACLLLLVGAGLLVRSLGRLLAVDPGFHADNVTTVALDLPERKYPDAAAQRAYVERALGELAPLPGAEVVAAAQSIPLGRDWVFAFSTSGSAPTASVQSPSANFYAVTPSYFRAMGIPLRGGRTFTSADGADGAPVAIVDEKLARQFFPAGDALGKHIIFDPPRQHEIVGIVADVKQYGLGKPATYQLYTPFAQDSFAALTLIVRGTGDPAALVPDLRARLRGIDADQPLGTIRTMNALVSDSMSRQRFAVVLLGVFAGIAMLLAMVGIYGVISDAVTHRTREMGIRLALGARARDCMRLIMVQSLAPIALGLVIGLAAAVAVTRVMASLLYEVSATDPTTLGVATMLIAGMALIASYLPARRATRVDPMIALRSD